MSDRYSYRVIWSEGDQEHVGLCTEFPSLSWLADTPEKALRGIRKVVSGVVEEMRETGEKPPVPLSTRKFSGKFQVRVTPDVQRHLVMEAAEEGVSLNRLVSARLALG